MADDFARVIGEGFRFKGTSVPLGAALRAGVVSPELPVGAALSLLNRHGLVAGATGTGKTKTLQGMAEKLSALGVPVFLADLKGDLSGLAAPGVATPAVQERAKSLGVPFAPLAFPVEFLSLTGKHGAALRTTVADFGPLLLAKALDLNDTQASVLSLVFKFADDQHLPLLDLADLRAVVSWLAGDDPPDLSLYGGLSKSTAGVLARKLTELESQGAGAFFGEPAFDIHDLLRTAPDGRGVISILELSDVQDRPRLFSTFLMWLLAELYEELPERGDADKPLLVFFFDEAHYLFDDASKALTEQITQVVRLIRSKGVGIFFVTQTPRDVPAPVLEQLGNRVQHALRAFTPNDAKALKATVSTFPITPYYDLEETLTTLAIGEAVVSVLAESGSPAPVVACRMLPPSSRMAPLSEAEFTAAVGASPLAARLAQAVDRESAREMLASRIGTPGRAAPSSGSPVGVPKPEPQPQQGAVTGGQVAAGAAAVLGGLFKFATKPPGQALIRGVLGDAVAPAVLMVAGLLALFLGVAPTAAIPDSTPFDRFAFRYETGWNDKIDTLDSTITRDNCGDPPVRGKANLSQKQLRPIYQRLIGMGAFSLPEPRPAIVDTILCSFRPSTWIRIDLRAGKTIRHYSFDRGGSMPCPPFEGDWQRLFQVKAYLDSVLQALPEYRRLPHKRCERL